MEEMNRFRLSRPDPKRRLSNVVLSIPSTDRHKVLEKLSGSASISGSKGWVMFQVGTLLPTENRDWGRGRCRAGGGKRPGHIWDGHIWPQAGWCPGRPSVGWERCDLKREIIWRTVELVK